MVEKVGALSPFGLLLERAGARSTLTVTVFLYTNRGRDRVRTTKRFLGHLRLVPFLGLVSLVGLLVRYPELRITPSDLHAWLSSFFTVGDAAPGARFKIVGDRAALHDIKHHLANLRLLA